MKRTTDRTAPRRRHRSGDAASNWRVEHLEPRTLLAFGPLGPAFQVNTIPWAGYQSGADVAAAPDGSFVVAWASDQQDGFDFGVYAQRFDPAGRPLGGEFLVNTTLGGSQAYPSVAVGSDGDFVIAWLTWSTYGSDVHARRYDAGGRPLGPEFRVNGATARHVWGPSVAADGDGDFVVTWSTSGDGGSDGLRARRYGADGAPLGQEILVSSGGSLLWPSVGAGARGEFVVAWTATGSVHARRFDAAGEPVGAAFRVNTTTDGVHRFPSVAVDADGDFVVAWTGGFVRYDPGDHVYAQRYDAAGVPQGGELRVTDAPVLAPYPSVAADADGDFVVTWDASGADGVRSAYARRYDATGRPLDEPFRVNGASTQYGSSPAVAADADGDFVVAFTADGASGAAIYARRFDSAGQPAGDEFRVNTTGRGIHSMPSVASAADGRFVAAWTIDGPDTSSYGVYARRYDAAGQPLGTEFRVNTTTAGAQSNPAVAMEADGDFVVVWTSRDPDRTGSGTYAQRYAADGRPLGAEFRVSAAAGYQIAPDVAMDADGDFVVTWMGYSRESYGADEHDVYARRFDRDGQALGEEFRVNNVIAKDWADTEVAMGADGGFAVAWSSFDSPLWDYNVYSRRYDATGQPLGDPFHVHRGINGVLAIGAGGDVVIAVQEGTGLVVRRYDAAGAPQGPAVRVNGIDSYFYVRPALAMNAAGDYVVAWMSGNAFCDDDYHGDACPPTGRLYARRFDAAGRPLGEEFYVHDGVDPVAAMDADGDVVIAWQGRHGIDRGIFARRYGNLPDPRVTNVFVAGTEWTGSFRQSLAAQGLGEEAFGYELSIGDGQGGAGQGGPGQSGVIPWSNVNRVSVRFAEPVPDAGQGLMMSVQASDYRLTAFQYDRATNTATWTLDRPAPPGGMTFVLGPGAAGGGFRFHFDTLPGDATRDGRVNALDVADVKRRVARRPGDGVGSPPGSYSIFNDVNADGVIDALDLAAVKQRLTQALPNGSPATALLFRDEPAPG